MSLLKDRRGNRSAIPVFFTYNVHFFPLFLIFPSLSSCLPCKFAPLFTLQRSDGRQESRMATNANMLYLIIRKGEQARCYRTLYHKRGKTKIKMIS